MQNALAYQKWRIRKSPKAFFKFFNQKVDKNQSENEFRAEGVNIDRACRSEKIRLMCSFEIVLWKTGPRRAPAKARPPEAFRLPRPHFGSPGSLGSWRWCPLSSFLMGLGISQLDCDLEWEKAVTIDFFFSNNISYKSRYYHLQMHKYHP